EAPYFKGTFGDYFYLYPNHTVFKVPDELPDELVVGVNCAMAQVTAGLDLAGVGIGDNVVIQGAGGLGLYAIAVARERGAGQIIVIDGGNSYQFVPGTVGSTGKPQTCFGGGDSDLFVDSSSTVQRTGAESAGAIAPSCRHFM
ncbi:hypothetical protein B4Q13_19770, partial [Lacticaseibacillus rhamnosus]